MMTDKKRSDAHRKADAAYIERQKESGVKPRKFMLNDAQAQCLRGVEAFIKKDEKNINILLDIIGNR
jgi:hypothetical protein